MADTHHISEPKTDTPGVGVRGGDDRRHRDRRGSDRMAAGRRRRDRRRSRMRTLLLAAAALATTHTTRTHATPLRPGVAVSIDDVRALQPERAYDDIIREAAAQYDLDPELIRAVMRAESAFNPLVVSPAGAQGLMQLMPGTAHSLGVQDPFDPFQNVLGGSRYLQQQLRRFGSVEKALAAYNAGPGAVERYGGIPPYRETQNYVRRVMQLLHRLTQQRE
jgi:soluble lytic murein transglycosylase-like protein